jgi:hypothetical protein
VDDKDVRFCRLWPQCSRESCIMMLFFPCRRRQRSRQKQVDGPQWVEIIFWSSILIFMHLPFHERFLQLNFTQSCYHISWICNCGPSMKSQRKTHWKDPKGSLQLLWGHFTWKDASKAVNWNSSTEAVKTPRSLSKGTVSSLTVFSVPCKNTGALNS